VCNECYHKICGIKTAAKNKPAPEDKKMNDGRGRKKTNIDWDAVQRDRDAGTSVAKLVTKYGVSNFTIYAYTKGSKKSGPKKKDAAAPARGAWHAEALRALRQRRDELDDLISRLEAL
jgi:hypothetical protein